MILPDTLDKKALVTGASGFVGGRLRDALLEAGAEVVTIRRPSSPPADRGRSIETDYDDVAALERVIGAEKPHYVFHVAGATKGVSYEDFQRANVMPTRSLLEAAKRAHAGLERFVLVSSLASYGPSSASRPLVESDPQRPVEHYGESKREAEQVLARTAGEVAWTIVRPAGVYGPGDRDYFNLFREVEKGRNVYFGNRQRWFSAVYVDDCVRAIVAAARASTTVGKGYFVCDGRPITWQTFQAAIVAASGKRVREVDLPGFLVPLAAVGGEMLSRLDKKPRLFNRQKAKMGAQEAFTCRHDAARDDFGYRPEVDVHEGVRRTLAWYRTERWL
jgi:nucleoside-diphosphate-sugar epimerase